MHCSIKVKLISDDDKTLFCPGAAELFGCIEKEGSVSKGAKLMGLSLSKAWKIIKRTEEAAGEPMIECVQGGAGGGRSKLTESCINLLKRYESIKAELEKKAQELL